MPGSGYHVVVRRRRVHGRARIPTRPGQSREHSRRARGRDQRSRRPRVRAAAARHRRGAAQPSRGAPVARGAAPARCHVARDGAPGARDGRRVGPGVRRIRAARRGLDPGVGRSRDARPRPRRHRGPRWPSAARPCARRSLRHRARAPHHRCGLLRPRGHSGGRGARRIGRVGRPRLCPAGRGRHGRPAVRPAHRRWRSPAAPRCRCLRGLARGAVLHGRSGTHLGRCCRDRPAR